MREEPARPQRRPSLPASGWLPDPSETHLERYWDGSRWTPRTRDRVTKVETGATASAAYQPRAWAPVEPRRPRTPSHRWIMGLSVALVAMWAYHWVQPYLPGWANVGAQVAALTTPDAPEVDYPTYGSGELVEYLEAHLIAQTARIDVSRWAHRDGMDAVDDALMEALVQNPYVYANGGQWRDTGARVTYEPLYRYSDADAEHRRAVTRQAVDQGLVDSGAATATSAAAKVTAIHDYVVSIADYDYTAYDLITSGATDGARVDQSQEAYGIFAAGTAVCNGYAQAFLAMADAAGLDAVQVTGTVSSGMTVGNHAWNKVLIDGRWLVVDTTWDDPLPGEPPQREYLMIPANDPLLVTRVEDTDWMVDSEIGTYAS